MQTIPTTHCARKHHSCDWCGEKIEPGEKYRRYRWYADADAGTTKLHVECWAAAKVLRYIATMVESELASSPLSAAQKRERKARVDLVFCGNNPRVIARHLEEWKEADSALTAIEQCLPADNK